MNKLPIKKLLGTVYRTDWSSVWDGLYWTTVDMDEKQITRENTTPAPIISQMWSQAEGSPRKLFSQPHTKMDRADIPIFLSTRFSPIDFLYFHSQIFSFNRERDQCLCYVIPMRAPQ